MSVAVWRDGAILARVGTYATFAAYLLLAIAAPGRPVWETDATPAVLAGYVLWSAAALLAARKAPELRLAEPGNSWGWFVIAQGVTAAVAILSGFGSVSSVPDSMNGS